MELKVGDKVKFLNNVGGGVVTKIVSNKIVEVRDEQGFNVPVLREELILLDEEVESLHFRAMGGSSHNDLSPQGGKQEAKTATAPSDQTEQENYQEVEFEKQDNKTNVFLAFIPESETDYTASDLMSFLVNDSHYEMFYNIARPTQGGLVQSQTGILKPNSLAETGIYKREELNELTQLHLQVLFFKQGSYELKSPLNREIKINPVWFFKESKFKENRFFYEEALMIQVFEEDRMKAALQKLTDHDLEEAVRRKEQENKRLNQPKRFKPAHNPDKEIEIVDLHLHELIDDERGLSNHDKLQVQMKHFHQKMAEAIKQPSTKKIVFIHGVGNGKLKLELRRELERKYKKYKFQDASFKDYGYGATMVYLR